MRNLQGCWRAVGSTFGKSITFKTTVKGSNMLMKNGLGDLWMPCVCFLGLLASLGFGLHKVGVALCLAALDAMAVINSCDLHAVSNFASRRLLYTVF